MNPVCDRKMSESDAGDAAASVPLEIIGIVSAVLLCAVVLVVCRIWKRNRYYKKVQHSLDEEERAFQETLARGYNDEQHLDGGDHERLQMLETYLQMQAEAGGADGATFRRGSTELPMPTHPEDVDKFMQELAAAASGDGDEDGPQRI
jgi:hypothetical protein